MNECLHEFDCINTEESMYDYEHTYKCNICNEIRIEYQDKQSGELIDYDIIQEGKTINNQ